MANSNEINPSKTFTDEERLSLADKLDKELDDFINSLGGKKYTDGWPEDKWQEEMAKHPFFMKKAPEPGEAVHPLFEGMQQLKYDPEENTSDQLALNYKEDGNFYMKHKKFRTAIYAYTEGLKVKSENIETNALLYNNRSAANFFLQNYRSSLLDAEKALKHKPDYHKAKWRAAQCLYFIKKYDECIKFCNEIIENHQENDKVLALLRDSKFDKLKTERDERKKQIVEKKRQDEFQKILRELKNQGVKFDDIKNNKITEDYLKPKFLPLEDYPCKIQENGTLSWPAVFSYPEFLFSDFQQSLNEEVIMKDCLLDLFKDPLPCDLERKYYTENVNVYYENRIVGSVHKLNISKTIKQIVNEKSFFVSGGSLLFYIVPSDSDIEEKFINEKRRPLTY